MTTTRRKGRKVSNPAPGADSGEGNLALIFDDIKRMMGGYSPPFKEGGGQIRGKRDYHLIVPKPVVLAPNAYGGKPYPVAMASLVLQKDFVGFYFMPVYIAPGIKNRMSPELAKLLKGKSCFHVRVLPLELRQGIRDALELGVQCFRERGWV
ncbi:MAG: hypothetical protein WAK20_07695 [Candidatus Acidiferrum sp.]